MAVSWAWRVEYLNEDGNIFDMDETKDYSEAIQIAGEALASNQCHSVEVPLVRTVWNHNEGVTDEDYMYPPFSADDLAAMPKKYASQYSKEVK